MRLADGLLMACKAEAGPMSLPRLRSFIRTLVPPAPNPEFLVLTTAEGTGTYEWNPHQHPQPELIIAHSDYRALVNGSEVRLSAGDALLLRPSDWHQDCLRRGTTYTAIWFRLPLIDELFVAGAPAQAGVARGIGAAVAPFLELLAGGEATARLQDPAMAAIFWTVLSRLPAELLNPPFVGAPDDADRQALITCFERHVEEPLVISIVAKELGWSPRTLTRRCHELLGSAPAKAHSKIRLERAAQFLAHSTLSVQQVAETLGYANAFHFSRVFTKHHGKPPSLWRQIPSEASAR